MQNRVSLFAVCVLLTALLQVCAGEFKVHVVRSNPARSSDVTPDQPFVFIYPKSDDKLLYLTYAFGNGGFKVYYSEDFWASPSLNEKVLPGSHFMFDVFQGVNFNETNNVMPIFINKEDSELITSLFDFSDTQNEMYKDNEGINIGDPFLWSMQHGDKQYFLLNNKICPLGYDVFMDSTLTGYKFDNGECTSLSKTLNKVGGYPYLYANDVFENGIRYGNSFIHLEDGEVVSFREEGDDLTFMVDVKGECKVPIIFGVPLLYRHPGEDDMKPENVIGVASAKYTSIFFDKFSGRFYYAGPSGLFYTEQCSSEKVDISEEQYFTSEIARDYAWTMMNSGNLVVCGISRYTDHENYTCVEIQIENCTGMTDVCLTDPNCAVVVEEGNRECSTRRKCQDPGKCISTYLDADLFDTDENTRESFLLTFDVKNDFSNKTGFQCVVDSTHPSDVIIANTNFTCNVLDIHTSSEVVQTHSVILAFLGEPVTKNITFETINCTHLKSCTEIGEYKSKCGWCLKTGKGVSLLDSDSCEGFLVDDPQVCPRSLSVSPGSITKNLDQNLHVSMSWLFDYVPSEQEFHCVFAYPENDSPDSEVVFNYTEVIDVSFNSYHKYFMSCKSPKFTDLENVYFSLCISKKDDDCEPYANMFGSENMMNLSIGYCDGYYLKEDCIHAKHENGNCMWLVDKTGSAARCSDENVTGYSEHSFPEYYNYTGPSIDLFAEGDSVTQVVVFNFSDPKPLKGLKFKCYQDNKDWSNEEPDDAVVSGSLVTCTYSISTNENSEGNFYLVMKDGSKSKSNWQDGFIPVGDPIPFSMTICDPKDKFGTCTSHKHCGFSYDSTDAMCGKKCAPYTEETMDYTTQKRIAITSKGVQYIDRKDASVFIDFKFFPNATDIGRSFVCILSNDELKVSLTTTLVPYSRTTVLCNFTSLENLPTQRYDLTITDADPSCEMSFGYYKVQAELVDCHDDSANNCNSCFANKTTGCSWSMAVGKCVAAGMKDSYSANSLSQCNTYVSFGSTKGYSGDKITITGPNFINPSIFNSDYVFLKRYKITNVDEFKYTAVFVAGQKGDTDMPNSQFTDGESGGQAAAVVEATLNEVDNSLTFEVPSISPGSYSVYVRFNGVDFVDDYVGFHVEKRPFPLWIIILIAVGGALILVAILIPIIIKVRRYTLEHSDFKFDVNNKPDFAPYMFSTTLSPNESDLVDMSPDEWSRFRALMRSPVVAKAIATTIDASEMEKVGKALMYVNASEASAQNIMKVLFEVHVNSCSSKELLFRENCLATYSFQAYCMIVGLDYLWTTIARFEHELHHDIVSQKGAAAAGVEMDAVSATSGPSNLSADAELDPTRASAGSDSQANVYLLSARVRSLIVALLDSTDNMPPSLRSAASCVRTVVEEKFPDATRRAIGGTIILRFINPAITLPERYCLLTTPDRKKTIAPDADLRRQYTMASKVLQCLANGVLMGKKEQYMSAMNSFIVKNQEPLDEWLERISQPISFQETAISVPQDVLEASCQRLHRFFVINKQKVCPAIEDPQIRASLEALI